jgi:hypothetical protein
MSFRTRVGVAVFALVFGPAVMVARADEKASKSADAKAEAKADAKSEKSAKATAEKAADKTKATAEKVGDATKDAKEAKETKKAVKLVQPWNKLTTLSEDQKDKINAIHQKALAETNAIKKREKTEIEALLTDEQKSELREIAAQEKKADAEKKTPKKDEAAPKADEKKAKDAA